MYLIKLAFRNIGRNRRRSLLAFISVSLSIMFIIFMQGMTGGILESIVKNYTKNETGHIRITTQEFQNKYRFYPITENISGSSEIINKVASDNHIKPYISSITDRINFGVLLTNNGKTKTAIALAGNPEKEKDLLMLDRFIQKGGHYIRKEREMVIGCKTAAALNYKTGDTMKVVTQGSDNALHMRKFIVAGIFETGLNALDDMVFQISITDARELLRMGKSTQQIVVMLKDQKKAEFVADLIKKKLNDPEIAVTPWTQIGDYGNLVRTADNIYQFVYGLIALLGAFIIGNIMTMIVLERRKEIGILKSMGMPGIEILQLFLTEGAILGTIGTVSGLVLGTILVVTFHFTGIDFSAISGSLRFPIDNVIYFSVDPVKMVQVLFLGILVSAIISAGPAWKASKLSAIDSIKSV